LQLHRHEPKLYLSDRNVFRVKGELDFRRLAKGLGNRQKLSAKHPPNAAIVLIPVSWVTIVQSKKRAIIKLCPDAPICVFHNPAIGVKAYTSMKARSS
jgi:hypothetical protein